MRTKNLNQNFSFTINLIGGVTNNPQWQIWTRTRFFVKLQRWGYIIHARGNTIHFVTICSRTNTWISSKAIFSLYNSLSLSLSLFHFLYVSFFALILPYTCPTFFSRVWCPCSIERLIVTSGFCFPIFIMNGDFWGSKHFLGQSFINKWNYTKQVSLINAEMTVALSRSFSRLS